MSAAAETSIDIGSDAAEAFVQTAGQAKSEAHHILADPDGPYWHTAHPLHRETVEKVTALYATAHGDSPGIDENGQSSDWHDQFEAALEPPKSSDAYDFTEVALAPDEVWDSNSEAMARDWLHRAGISESETKSFVSRFNEVRFYDEPARSAMAADSETSLRTSWGLNFNANLASARAAVDALGPEFKGFLEESGLADDHATALTLHRVAKANGL